MRPGAECVATLLNETNGWLSIGLSESWRHVVVVRSVAQRRHSVHRVLERMMYVGHRSRWNRQRYRVAVDTNSRGTLGEP